MSSRSEVSVNQKLAKQIGHDEDDENHKLRFFFFFFFFFFFIILFYFIFFFFFFFFFDEKNLRLLGRVSDREQLRQFLERIAPMVGRRGRGGEGNCSKFIF